MCAQKTNEELVRAISAEFESYKAHLCIEALKRLDDKNRKLDDKRPEGEKETPQQIKAKIIEQMKKVGYDGLSKSDKGIVDEAIDAIRKTIEPVTSPSISLDPQPSNDKKQLAQKIKAFSGLYSVFDKALGEGEGRIEANAESALRELNKAINSPDSKKQKAIKILFDATEQRRDSHLAKFVSKLLDFLSFFTSNLTGKVEGRDLTGAIKKNVGLFDKQEKAKAKAKAVEEESKRVDDYVKKNPL